MKRMLIATGCVLALAAHAQQVTDLGQVEFQTSCSGCHGTSAKGDGPVARYLTRAPSDLTTLSRRNGGVFPSQRIYETIDGRTSTEIGPHGSRDMPIWGRVYRSLAMEPGAGEASPGTTARSRMAALMDYLVRIQAN